MKKKLENLTKETPPVATVPAVDTTNSIVSALEAKPELTKPTRDVTPSSNDVAVLKQTARGANATAFQKQGNIKSEVESNMDKATQMQDSFQADSSAVAVTAQTGAKDLSKKIDTIRNMNVTMKSSDVALNEVVVMKNKSLSPDVKRRMHVVVDTLEPAEGWTNFDDYIVNNLRMPDELKSKPLHGEVELAFDVNKEGDPVNITVVKSLCEKCDEEAIRLLKAGPKWKNNNKKKGKVKIKF